MSIADASLKEKLWHKMREDLQLYYSETKSNSLLMCCTCGRFLSYEDFSIEHIVPRQALADDPLEIKSDASLSINTRSGITLLCNKPLRIKEKTVYKNGCNSWKGRFYDKPIRELLNGRALDDGYRRVTQRDIIALISAAYIAMVRQYGYQIALTQSGLTLRQQFFMPTRFQRGVPLSSQLVLGSHPVAFDPMHAHMWNDPFKFEIERGSCVVIVRTMAVRLPLSRDPRTPVAKHLVISPPQYKLRPDFRTVFD